MADGARLADGSTATSAEISSRVPEDHGIEVLRLGDEDATVIVQVEDTHWLIREYGSYEAMVGHEADQLAPGCLLADYSGDYPFCTSGTRWMVNLDTGQGARREFYAQEGQIQGLVYALGALMHGGNLSPEAYAHYIKDLLNAENVGRLETDREFDAVRRQAGL